MKKILLISPILFVLGCKSTNAYIKHSDVAIVSNDSKHLYICDAGHGRMIYDCWSRGCYGDTTIVHLVDSNEFKKLSKQSVPCTCSSGAMAKRAYTSNKQ